MVHTRVQFLHSCPPSHVSLNRVDSELCWSCGWLDARRIWGWVSFIVRNGDVAWHACECECEHPADGFASASLSVGSRDNSTCAHCARSVASAPSEVCCRSLWSNRQRDKSLAIKRRDHDDGTRTHGRRGSSCVLCTSPVSSSFRLPPYYDDTDDFEFERTAAHANSHWSLNAAPATRHPNTLTDCRHQESAHEQRQRPSAISQQASRRSDSGQRHMPILDQLAGMSLCTFGIKAVVSHLGKRG